MSRRLMGGGGKGIASKPEVPQSGRRELTPAGCSLTFTRALWHAYSYTHMHIISKMK